MLRPSRTFIAGVLLLAVSAAAVLVADMFLREASWYPTARFWAPMAVIVALAVVGNVARLFNPKRPRAKKRPTHLKLVREPDETLH